MAKINHNNFIDTINNIMVTAKEEGIVHLQAEDAKLTGRTIQIKGKKMLHFGTTGYLGLEQDIRLKNAAIEAIQNFGTQFPLSKSYIAHPLYAELEDKIQEMYGITPIITKNSTLGHLAVIPTLIRDEDAVIIDHQVHWSVQNACQLLKLRGIPVEMVRHNNLEMIENTIKKLGAKAKKVWYMADGVYSMYGDYAPINELIELSNKYNYFHLYFDDVHGMSWIGKNGTGFVFDQIKELTDKIVVVGTLSKTFGASGATFFCQDKDLRNKIKNFGGPLTFSAQLEPASVAAAIAAAKIHLSPEITTKQIELQAKIEYLNEQVTNKNIPLISINNSPVFYIGCATPNTAYNLIQRLYNEGIFLNLGIYPAVAIKNTGIRLTISSHNEIKDIQTLVEALDYHLPKALLETNNSLGKIQKAFGLKAKEETSYENIFENNFENIIVSEYNTINKIPKDLWNSYMGKSSVTDYNGMQFLEHAFKETRDTFNQSDFYYYIITDKKKEVIAITFLTLSTWKDDMLATESVSKKAEQEREKNPIYLTSRVLSMGSLFTEGTHWYCNNSHEYATEAIKTMLQIIEDKKNECKADSIVLRDFTQEERWSKTILEEGYVQIDMPESCVFFNNKWDSIEEYKALLSKRSQKHFKKEIEANEDLFEITCVDQLSNATLERAYKLYENVKDNNWAINTYKYSYEVFEKMNANPNWEFILLSLKEDPFNKIVGVMFAYKNENNRYVPELIGLDYEVSAKYKVYKQLLFQTIKRANQLKIENIDFGISASFEKKKVGATCIPKIAFIQTNDNFKMELLNTMQNDFK